MASEYDALLAPPPEQKSEYDALLTPTPTAETPTAPIVQPSVTEPSQSREATRPIVSLPNLTDAIFGTGGNFVRAAQEEAGKLIPRTFGDVGRLVTGATMPFLEAPTAIRGAVGAIEGEPQDLGPLKQLEDIKTQYGGGSPQYQEAAGRAAGQILPQMAMLALPKLTEDIFGRGRFPTEEPTAPDVTKPPAPIISEQAAAEVQPKVGEITLPQQGAIRPISSGAPSVPTPSVESSGVAAKFLSDVANFPASGVQDFGSLNVEARRIVVPTMLRVAVHNPQIADSIIRTVPVDVMNNLIGEKWTTQSPLDNLTVLANKLSADPNSPVSIRTASGILEGISTLHGAKVTNPDVARFFSDLDSTSQTINKGGLPVFNEPSTVGTEPVLSGHAQDLTAEQQITQVEKGGKNATKEGVIPESNIPEYTGDETVRPPTEAGGGGGNVPSAEIQGQEKVAPAAEPQPPAATAEKPPIQTSVDDPHVSAIANRFVKERAAKGEIGEIAPGQGYSTQELVQRGLKMSPEEVNQHVSDLMQGGGDPIKQGMAVRAEEARLSQRSAELSKSADANPSNIEAKLAADNAFKDLQDFHNGPVARLKQNWHAQGMGLQGEIPVDLSTFNGMREAWLRDTGEAPPPNIEPTLRRTAQKVATSVAEENGAMSKLGQEIEKVTSRSKLPTAEEVRNNIMERLKQMPCPT